MKTYQEYLTENGATQEEIAVLATPKAIAAYNKIQADAEASREAAIAALNAERDQKNQEWWENDYQPGLSKRDQQILELSGENARIKAALAKAKELGLTQVAIDAGHEPEPPNKPAGVPDGFDPKQYVKVSDIESFMDRAGAGLADMQELAAEHYQLFGVPLTGIEAMRKIVVASRGQKTLRSVWEEQHKVGDKRKEIEAARQKKHDDEVAANAIANWAKDHGVNPEARIPVKSRNSFVSRPIKDGDKQVWEKTPVELQKARVEKFRSKVM